MQWSPATGKSKSINARKVAIHNNNIVIVKARSHVIRRIHTRVALQQQAAGFKVAILGREMQWGVFTEEKQNN